MKKLTALVVLCLLSLHILGQGYYRRIDEGVIERIRSLFFQEQYKECYDSCFYYNIASGFYDFGYSRHPYREYAVDKKYHLPVAFLFDRIEDISYVLYMGAISAYKYNLTDFDSDSAILAIEWARACANISRDYIQEKKPNAFWTADDVYEFIFYGDRGIEATQIGDELLHIFEGKDRYAKHEEKWFRKTGVTILKTLGEKLSVLETKYSEYPLLQYRITDICTTSSLLKKRSALKEYEDFLSKQFDAFTNLIENNTNNRYDSDIYIALNKLTSMLTHTVIEQEYCEKIGNNYERFCMENLIKLQDISYCLGGSSRYEVNPTYTLDEIQNCLQETDCAIVHFEAPVMSGHLYFRYDLGTRYRNYALIITKDLVVPDVWHRGYIKDDVVNDLSVIKETYPNAKRFFYVGTPRMSFIDVAGTDSSVVRLHSLSQLLYDWPAESEIDEVTFIGDINYEQVGNINVTNNVVNDIKLSENKGGDKDIKYKPLRGPQIELEHLTAINRWKVRPVKGDDATRNMVMSEISRSTNAVHISTHGELFNYDDDDLSIQDLALKKDVMDNSRLILAGYNDDPGSPLSSMSGSDVLEMKKSNAKIIFLDACLSGKGAVGLSGSVGMAEAFHLIGARYVICYLEPVSDDIATSFSDYFYKELAKGASCHDAFFRAKNSLNEPIKVILWE